MAFEYTSRNFPPIRLPPPIQYTNAFRPPSILFGGASGQNRKNAEGQS